MGGGKEGIERYLIMEKGRFQKSDGGGANWDIGVGAIWVWGGGYSLPPPPKKNI